MLRIMGPNVLAYSGGTITTLSVSGVTTPMGLAVDPSGSLLIADKSTGHIVRVPNESALRPLPMP